MICVVNICYSQIKAKYQPNLWSWIIMCCFCRFWTWQRGNPERRLLALHIQEQGKLTPLLILPTHDPLGLESDRYGSACPPAVISLCLLIIHSQERLRGEGTAGGRVLISSASEVTQLASRTRSIDTASLGQIKPDSWPHINAKSQSVTGLRESLWWVLGLPLHQDNTIRRCTRNPE